MNFKSSINTGNEGIYWLNKIKELKSDAAVIMITAYGDIDLAVRSLKEGASDFVVKPWHNEKLITIIKSCLENKCNQSIIKTPAVHQNFDKDILGESEIMKELFYKVEKIAPTDDLYLQN
jgi:DNA-binding NtrC family response regulator